MYTKFASPQELALLADAILAKTPRDPDRPHYVEAWFDRKLRIARARDRDNARRLSQDADPSAPLWRAEVRRLLDRAELTRIQAMVVRAFLLGQTWVEIGRRTGRTKQSAQQHFRAALRKLERAARTDPYAGLAEVYRAEVRRKGRAV
jgi:DNA-binding NarL/FixJ family response regulator